MEEYCKRFDGKSCPHLLGVVTEEDHTYTMTVKGAFYYHYYENFYTLASIDKMRGFMRKEVFPDKIDL